MEYAGLKKANFTNSSNKNMRNKYEPIVPDIILPFYKNNKGCKDAFTFLKINN